MAKDIFHDTVKNALIADGWEIIAEHLRINLDGSPMYVDIAAQEVIAAEKEGRKIAVEVKRFLESSPMNAFHTSLGQYLNYRLAIVQDKLDYTLYLAVPEEVYNLFFQLPFTRKVIEQYKLKLIVYNTETEVLEWIE